MTKTRTTSKTTTRTPTTHRVSKQNHIVSRVFHEDRLSGYKTPRLTTVVYEYNCETGVAHYGASLYREESPREVQRVFGTKQALRAALRRTATKRFETKPVSVVLPSKSIKDLHRKLRKAVAKYGVSA